MFLKKYNIAKWKEATQTGKVCQNQWKKTKKQQMPNKFRKVER